MPVRHSLIKLQQKTIQHCKVVILQLKINETKESQSCLTQLLVSVHGREGPSERNMKLSLLFNGINSNIILISRTKTTYIISSVLSPTLWDSVDCSPPGSPVPGDSPVKNTRVSSHALLQVIFPTQGSNPGLPHWGWVLYWLHHQGRESYWRKCHYVIKLTKVAKNERRPLGFNLLAW